MSALKEVCKSCGHPGVRFRSVKGILASYHAFGDRNKCVFVGQAYGRVCGCKFVR